MEEMFNKMANIWIYCRKVENQTFRHSNGTLPAFVFLSVFFVEQAQRENRGKHMKHKAHQARTKNTIISLHIVISWCLKPFSDDLMKTWFTCTSKQRGPRQTHKTQNTTGPAQRTQSWFWIFVIMGKRHTNLLILTAPVIWTNVFLGSIG